MKTYEFFGAMGFGVGAFLLAPKHELFSVGDWELGLDDVAFFVTFLVSLGLSQILRRLYNKNKSS